MNNWYECTHCDTEFSVNAVTHTQTDVKWCPYCGSELDYETLERDYDDDYDYDYDED